MPIIDPHICLRRRESHIRQLGNPESDQGRHALKASSEAYATTDSTTCKITMLDPAEIGARCEPAIVLQAAYLHESVHAADCAASNRIPAYFAPDGTRIDRARDIDIFGYANGVVYPLVPHSAWLLRPENTSRTEVAAYTTEARMLREWLAGNCPG